MHGAGLRDHLARREFVSAPGVFDMISARPADRTGFRAPYATGFGISASHLGLPDVGIATFSDMAARVGQIALERAYGALRDGQGAAPGAEEPYRFARMCTLMGFPDAWAFERRRAERAGADGGR